MLRESKFCNLKYWNKLVDHFFQSVTFETFERSGPLTAKFLSSLAVRLTTVSGDNREGAWLFQRLSLSIARHYVTDISACFNRFRWTLCCATNWATQSWINIFFFFPFLCSALSSFFLFLLLRSCLRVLRFGICIFNFFNIIYNSYTKMKWQHWRCFSYIDCNKKNRAKNVVNKIIFCVNHRV